LLNREKNVDPRRQRMKFFVPKLLVVGILMIIIVFSYFLFYEYKNK